jgi:hypothetical protein
LLRPPFFRGLAGIKDYRQTYSSWCDDINVVFSACPSCKLGGRVRGLGIVFTSLTQRRL